jgi:uridylate kinase
MKTIIISLGGSIITPDKPDYFFLKDFKNFIVRNLDNYRFILICGGGKTNSYYNEAALRVSNVKKEDLDHIGIMATRLNAELVRVIFGELAHEKVIYNPEKQVKTRKKIIVASGWRPGHSTDMVAVVLAKQFDVKDILNLTNISYLYDKDPNKFKNAKKISNASWEEYRKLITGKWSPRLSTPFDPIASKEAHRRKLKVAILKGTDLKNVEAYLFGKQFEGTVIG